MNDDFEILLDEIRIKLHEQTINMTNEEQVRFINESAQEIAREFGIKVSRSNYVGTSE